MLMTARAPVAEAARTARLAFMPADAGATLCQARDGRFQRLGPRRAPPDMPQSGLSPFGQNKIMMKEIPPCPQVHRLTTTRRFDQTQNVNKKAQRLVGLW